MGKKLTELKTIVPEMIVAVSDTEGITVRGISPLDILGLYRRHTGQLSALFEELFSKYSENGSTVTAVDIQQVTVRLISDCPAIMAEIIMLANGVDPEDEESWQESLEIAKLLPFPVQADALNKIGALTFTSEMPPKKFFALAVGAIQAAIKSLPTPSPVA